MIDNDDVSDFMLIGFMGKIFKYPGAFIRYIFLHKKKNFNEIIEEKTDKNSIVGFTVFTIISTLITFIVIFWD